MEENEEYNEADDDDCECEECDAEEENIIKNFSKNFKL